VPGYGVFYRVLTRMDPEALATRLNTWLQSQAGRLPAALALDGKMTRAHIGLLTLAQHEDGAPQAVAVYDQNEHTPRCEQTAAAALVAQLPALDDKRVTGDPLHCQRGLARAVVAKGGDYLFQIKGNQPTLLADLALIRNALLRVLADAHEQPSLPAMCERLHSNPQPRPMLGPPYPLLHSKQKTLGCPLRRTFQPDARQA
jgi:hypothetical protein